MNLVKLRVEHGLTQQDLADISGVSQASRESAADRAVRAAFSKSHLVQMRQKWSDE